MENYFCANSVEEQVDYLTDKVKDIITNKLDKASIVQETGTGTDVVMSQKAVTDAIANKGLDTLTGVNLTLGNTTVQYDTTNGIQLNSVARFTDVAGNHDATMELDLPVVGKDGIVIEKAADSEKIEVSGKNLIKDPYPGVNVTGAGIVNYKPINSADWGSAFIRNTHGLVSHAGYGAIVGYDDVGVIYAKTTSNDPWSVVNKEYADNNFVKYNSTEITDPSSKAIKLLPNGYYTLTEKATTGFTNNLKSSYYTIAKFRYSASEGCAIAQDVTNSKMYVASFSSATGTNGWNEIPNKKYVDDAIASISPTTQTKYQHNLILEGTQLGSTFKAFMSIPRSDDTLFGTLDEIVAALGDAYIPCTGYIYDGNQKSFSIFAFNTAAPGFEYNNPESGGEVFTVANDNVTVTDNVLNF